MTWNKRTGTELSMVSATIRMELTPCTITDRAFGFFSDMNVQQDKVTRRAAADAMLYITHKASWYQYIGVARVASKLPSVGKVSSSPCSRPSLHPLFISPSFCCGASSVSTSILYWKICFLIFHCFL